MTAPNSPARTRSKRMVVWLVVAPAVLLLLALALAYMLTPPKEFRRLAKMRDMRKAAATARSLGVEAYDCEESDGSFSVSYIKRRLLVQWYMCTHSADAAGRGILDPSFTQVGCSVLEWELFCRRYSPE